MKKIKENNWYSNQENIKKTIENIEIIKKTLNNYYLTIINPLKEELDLSSGTEILDIKTNYNILYEEFKKNLDIVNNLENEINKLTKKYDDLFLENTNKKNTKYNEHYSSTTSDGKNKKRTKSYSQIMDTYINSEDGEIYNTVSKKSVLIINNVESEPTQLSEIDEKIS